MSGDNYRIDFNISKNNISLIIHFRQKRHRRKKSCNKKICLKNHSVIHLELLATYAILPFFFPPKKKKRKKKYKNLYIRPMLQYQYSIGGTSLRPFSHGAGDARASCAESSAGPPALIDYFHMALAETTTRAYIFIFGIICRTREKTQPVTKKLGSCLLAPAFPAQCEDTHWKQCCIAPFRARGLAANPRGAHVAYRPRAGDGPRPRRVKGFVENNRN